MAVKLNTSDNYESIKVTLSKGEYPIAYNNKIEELVEQGLYKTTEDAENDNPTIEIEMEIYYEKHYGLFAVESGAVESGTIYSPYTSELCDDVDLFK